MCCVALSHACYIEEAASNSKSTLSLTFRSIISKIIRFFASAFACFGSDTAFVLMCIAHRSVCGCVFALYTLCLFVYLKNVFVFGVVYISQNGFSAKKTLFSVFLLISLLLCAEISARNGDGVYNQLFSTLLSSIFDVIVEF